MPEVQECTQRELPEVIGLVDDAMRQGMDQTMLTDYPLVYQESNHPNIRVIKVDGRVVSVVPFLLRTVDVEDVSFTIGIISPTATEPEHRHRGYGLACLRSCLQSMEQMGCDLSVLWTQIATFPFYQHGAFEPIRYQEWIYTCTREDGPPFPGPWRTDRALRPGDRNPPGPDPVHAGEGRLRRAAVPAPSGRHSSSFP